MELSIFTFLYFFFVPWAMFIVALKDFGPDRKNLRLMFYSMTFVTFAISATVMFAVLGSTSGDSGVYIRWDMEGTFNGTDQTESWQLTLQDPKPDGPTADAWLYVAMTYYGFGLLFVVLTISEVFGWARWQGGNN